jgi:cytoskeletal protein CcmA (bactofilin family)
MADSAATVVGPSILINGNLQGDEDLTVLGRVEGNISLTRTLHVEESGIVKADISVRNAVVSGVVVGNITATDSVELTEAGRMVGDIRAPRVIIVDGARFRGAVDMGDLDSPRATGELPKRTVGTLTRTSNNSASSSLPARRPTPAPVRAQAPATPTNRVVSGNPNPNPLASRRDTPISARPSASSEDTTAIGARQAPVLASKKLKKKVVVKKKV